ncbi:MAG: hypothetical protein H5U02_09325, partial [Clostridia bacterium]|nr:hypothetical protein [Clostridia bacterium]
PTATIGLRVGEEVYEEAACGEGPVDAAFRAIEKITGVEVSLKNYSLNAVTSGCDAMGEVTVQLAYQDKTFIGKGLSTDIIEASARAYINALNKITWQFEDEVKSKPPGGARRINAEAGMASAEVG